MGCFFISDTLRQDIVLIVEISGKPFDWREPDIDKAAPSLSGEPINQPKHYQT
jgi:hypothetical protein